jgi:hypothetical protein
MAGWWVKTESAKEGVGFLLQQQLEPNVASFGPTMIQNQLSYVLTASLCRPSWRPVSSLSSLTLPPAAFPAAHVLLTSARCSPCPSVLLPPLPPSLLQPLLLSGEDLLFPANWFSCGGQGILPKPRTRAHCRTAPHPLRVSIT